LKWAIAGRNGSKLRQIAEELRVLNPDRVQPAIEVVELKSDELHDLARKTQVLITTVGPYWRWGAPVVEACASEGTHYLDVTGETPFTYDMLQKHHEMAKKNGVVIVPHCGIDSVPADLLAYLCVREIRSSLNCGVTECINSLQKISGGLSGGTANTALTLVEAYPLRFLGNSMKPYALSPIPPPKDMPKGAGILSALLGYRRVPDLGILTNSPQAGSDVGIVHRSWGLFSDGEWYGKKFSFSEFMRVKSGFMGTIVHYIFGFVMIGLYFRPFRWLMKKMVYQPGQGPTKEETKSNRLSYRCIATADDASRKRAVSTFDYTGGGYYMTGILVAEAAMVVLRGSENLGKKLGGMVTPACLEMEYVDRLRKAGIKIEVEMMNA